MHGPEHTEHTEIIGAAPPGSSANSNSTISSSNSNQQVHAHVRRRIILLGKTGEGKSSIACKLLGRPGLFKEGESLDAETFQIQCEVGHWFGDERLEIFEVIDTPGFCDTLGRSPAFIRQLGEFLRALAPAGGLTCVLCCFSAFDNRFNTVLSDSLQVITRLLGQDVWQRTLFVTTQWNRMNQAEIQRALSMFTDRVWHKKICQALDGTIPPGYEPRFCRFNYDAPDGCLQPAFDYFNEQRTNYRPQVSEELEEACRFGRSLQESIAESRHMQALIDEMRERANRTQAQLDEVRAQAVHAKTRAEAAERAASEAKSQLTSAASNRDALLQTVEATRREADVARSAAEAAEKHAADMQKIVATLRSRGGGGGCTIL